MSEQRESIRVQLEMDVDFLVNENSWKFHSATENLSEGGASFSSNFPIEVNTRIQIILFGFSEVPAMIRRCDKNENYYDIGIQFLDLSTDTKILLKQIQRLNNMTSL